MQLVMGHNNVPILKPTSQPAGSRKLKSRGELAEALPDFAEFMRAHAKVCQVLSLAGHSLAGMPLFQENMVRLAGHISHADKAEWAMFLELDRTLRLKQHAYRRSWGHAGGLICPVTCSAFVSQMAGRHAALATAPQRHTPRLPGAQREPRLPFRPTKGGADTGTAPGEGKDCKKWWFTGTCSFGKKCKYNHTCATCGSSSHGTAQCPRGGASE